MTAIVIRRRKLGRTSCREISAKSTTGIVAVRNDKPMPQNVDLVFRWGCTSNVPTNNVVNTSEAIHRVSDKKGFRMLLNEHELSPMTWDNQEAFEDYIDHYIEEDNHLPLPFPVVVRRATHHQGRFLDVCNKPSEVDAACAKYGEDNYYISPLINKIAEYRVCCVSGRVAWVANKIPADPTAVAWNVAQGGTFENVGWKSWPLKAVKVALEAFELSGLDFGGVDIMVDADGNCFVLEINSAPSLTSPYRQQCMAKCFDYIVQYGKQKIPLISEKGGYSKFIHPAVCDHAKLVGA